MKSSISPAVLSFLGVFSSLLLAPSLCVGQPLYETYSSVSVNPSFEKDLTGWYFQELEATLIDRLPRVDINTTANNLTAVQLTGRGGFGQFITLNPTIRHQLLRSSSEKAAEDGGIPGRAAIVVSYYDQDWNELIKYEYEINIRPANLVNRAFVPNHETYGTYVPEGAAFAFTFVWIYDENTVVKVDDLELLDAIRPTGPNANLVLNAEFDNEAYLDYSQPYKPQLITSGREFWSSNFELTPAARAEGFTMGGADMSNAIWQFVEMQAGKTYDLAFRVLGGFENPAPPAGSAIGVDFMDENFNLLSKQVVPMIPTEPSWLRTTIDTPPESVFEVFWVYVPPGPSKVMPGLVWLVEQQP